MKYNFSGNEDSKALKGAVLTIGNFDGLHLGHKQLIDILIKHARSENKISVLYTFFPHPVQVLFPEKQHKFLCSFDQNKELLHSAGVDHLLIRSFTKAFSMLSPEDFIERHIIAPIQPRIIVVGYNFRFGVGSAGSISLLRDLQKQHNFRLEVVEPVKIKGMAVSTSSIKRAILDGNWDLVPELLGRFFSIKGLVVRGEGRGKGMGFPTLNLQADPDTIIPSKGVYIARVKKKDQYFQSVINIGHSPTFNDNRSKRIEVHLIGRNEKWEGKFCEVEIVQYLRPEHKFSCSKDLIDQIKKDIDQARFHLDRL